jgi:hypothetical protein
VELTGWAVPLPVQAIFEPQVMRPIRPPIDTSFSVRLSTLPCWNIRSLEYKRLLGECPLGQSPLGQSLLGQSLLGQSLLG